MFASALVAGPDSSTEGRVLRFEAFYPEELMCDAYMEPMELINFWLYSGAIPKSNGRGLKSSR